ncbi:RAVR2 protein, partial [Formicarius rufipectus]|nr:RAVR2 protein [Formicarius rufipectus]
ASFLQEIHDLFKDYEIKYCYVDKNKRTAFVTLQDGVQAQRAVGRLQGRRLRGSALRVQLQPSAALLCITHLPASLSLQRFQQLLRTYGSLERCFLVYSQATGRSKGYGFVEYMKRDAAARARLELLGRQVEENTLLAQWVDAEQLTETLIHSKCLCVENLRGGTDAQELLEAFSSKHKPVFCQCAQEEDGAGGDFAVVEYESAEQAEEVRALTDGTTVGGRRVQVSFCAPGAPGRSTLAALIAAQRMMRNNRKGLLPEPSAVQIMKSFNNPAMLQMLLQPQLRGLALNPVFGASAGLPHLINSAVGSALLQLNKVHQSSILGSTSSLLLQSPAHLPQLLKMDNIQANSKPGLLGEPPAMLLQTVLGMGMMPAVSSGMGTRGEALKSPAPPAALGVLPFLPAPPPGAVPADGTASVPAPQPPPSLPLPAATPTVCPHPQLRSPDSSPGTPLKKQTSLLGEPPKEIRLSTNPYLNLASVLPGICLPAVASKACSAQPQTEDAAVSQGAASHHALDSYFSYPQQQGDYTQV